MNFQYNRMLVMQTKVLWTIFSSNFLISIAQYVFWKKSLSIFLVCFHFTALSSALILLVYFSFYFQLWRVMWVAWILDKTHYFHLDNFVLPPNGINFRRNDSWTHPGRFFAIYKLSRHTIKHIFPQPKVWNEKFTEWSEMLNAPALFASLNSGQTKKLDAIYLGGTRWKCAMRTSY